MRAGVAIVGGGIAGLTAAVTLRRAGVPFNLLEAGRQLGGLATTEFDADGFSYDFGAHFITNRLARAIGVASQCYIVHRYGESVAVRNRTIAYPLGLLARPEYVASAITTRMNRTTAAAPATTAEQWFRQEYGRALADDVAIPLLEKWSGLPARLLSAAVGQQMPSSILKTAYLKLAARLTNRAVASGYCSSLPESPAVWHVYPHGGVATLTARLGAEVADAIEYDARVSAIYVQDEAVVGIRANDRDLAVSAVVCSAPLDAVARMVRGTSKLEPLAAFRYRPMIFVNLRLRGRGLLPDVVLWTPEEDVPLFRLTEAPIAMPSLAPAGMTTVTCDIGASVDDEWWRASDDALAELCLNRLSAFVPDVRARYLGCRVMRTPIAYPVFALEYEATRQQLALSSGIRGLHLIGRNGEFRHLLMEDVYVRTRARMHELVRQQGPYPASEDLSIAS